METPAERDFNRVVLSWAKTDVLNTQEFRGAWRDWVQYRKEIRKPLTKTTIQRQVRRLEKWGHDKAIAAIDNSITNGWQGLFEPIGQGAKLSRGSGRVRDKPPGGYDD